MENNPAYNSLTAKELPSSAIAGPDTCYEIIDQPPTQFKVTPNPSYQQTSQELCVSPQELVMDNNPSYKSVHSLTKDVLSP